jgi:hypothetical protein
MTRAKLGATQLCSLLALAALTLTGCGDASTSQNPSQGSSPGQAPVLVPSSDALISYVRSEPGGSFIITATEAEITFQVQAPDVGDDYVRAANDTKLFQSLRTQVPSILGLENTSEECENTGYVVVTVEDGDDVWQGQWTTCTQESRDNILRVEQWLQPTLTQAAVYNEEAQALEQEPTKVTPEEVTPKDTTSGAVSP